MLSSTQGDYQTLHVFLLPVPQPEDFNTNNKLREESPHQFHFSLGSLPNIQCLENLFFFIYFICRSSFRQEIISSLYHSILFINRRTM